jgi:hypothetical protein
LGENTDRVVRNLELGAKRDVLGVHLRVVFRQEDLPMLSEKNERSVGFARVGSLGHPSTVSVTDKGAVGGALIPGLDPGRSNTRLHAPDLLWFHICRTRSREEDAVDDIGQGEVVCIAFVRRQLLLWMKTFPALGSEKLALSELLLYALNVCIRSLR